MALTARNAKLDTRTGRLKCEVRREPHWHVVSKGCAVGYRRIADWGTWIARMRDDAGRQHYEALGAADDLREPDGETALSFAQAQGRARAFFAQKSREFSGHVGPEAGPFTVEIAIDEYLAHRARIGSKGVEADTYAAKARIVPTLGAIEVSKLTAKRIHDWLNSVATAPKLVRTGKFVTTQATREFDPNDPEQVRKRRSTANRLLTVIKAALNHAFRENRTATDEAWRRVKPFREADAARIRYLAAEECKRLVNACPPDFCALVRGALATGCRYGELMRLTVADFNPEAGTVTVRVSKAGKLRHVALADEGQRIFRSLTAGKAASERVFRRADGKGWGRAHQQRPLVAASQIAKVAPPASFHDLRHTYASALAMRGVPMHVIAKQLGHSDTRMTEKHYAHLAPSYVADAVRAALPALGFFEGSNVVNLGRRAEQQ